MSNTGKIQKVTSKGQITLPIAWRRKVDNASTIIVHNDGDSLRISAFKGETEDDRDAEWVTLFDAIQNNNGKGIPAKEFAKMIRQANQEAWTKQKSYYGK